MGRLTSQKWFLIFGASVLLVSIFQNCADFASKEVATLDLPMNHPDTESVSSAAVSDKLLLGDKMFIRSVFEDVFTSSEMLPNERGGFDFIMTEEFEDNQNAFGRGCDVGETGTSDPCRYALANMNLKMGATTSSVREASKIQACRRSVAHESIFRHAVNKVKGRDLAPNKDSISKTIELFYRGLDESELETTVAKLQELDMTMAKASEPILDRWRMIFLTVCESPGWETL